MSTEIKLTSAQQMKALREKNKVRSDSEIYEDRFRLHPDGTKKCSGSCRQQKPINEFTNSRSMSDGLCGECKNCKRRRERRWMKKQSKRSANQIANAIKRLRPSGDKKCSGCQTARSLAEFSNQKGRADGYSDICKRCRAADNRLREARLAEMRDEVRKKGCVNCGVKDVRCIDLAHRNREDKLRNGKGKTIHPSRIQNPSLLANELKLVDPKCALCHAKQTHEEEHQLKLPAGHRPLDDMERDAKIRLVVHLEKTKRGGCTDCKLPVQDRFWLFDFDHVRGEKVLGIAQMVRYFNEANITLEMAKCDLRCKNCHRIATYERLKNKTK